MLQEQEIASLLKGARREEPEAVAALCEYLYPALLRYMRYRVGADFAADLTGDVLLRVIRGLAGQRGSFAAWLYKIAAHVVADHARSEKARREKPVDDELLRQYAETSDVAQTVARQIDVERAIGKLTDEQKELVTLKFLQGLSNAEIGEITGRKPAAIRGLQFRALSSLRRILEDGGYPHDA